MNNKIEESFEKTRIAGSIAAGALDEVAKIVKPGITTEEIDKLCYEYINDHKAFSAPFQPQSKLYFIQPRLAYASDKLSFIVKALLSSCLALG